MTLSEDEIKEVTKKLVRCNIDLNQGMNYFLNSDYTNGRKNFLEVVRNLGNILDKIKD